MNLSLKHKMNLFSLGISQVDGINIDLFFFAAELFCYLYVTLEKPHAHKKITFLKNYSPRILNIDQNILLKSTHFK